MNKDWSKWVQKRELNQIASHIFAMREKKNTEIAKNVGSVAHYKVNYVAYFSISKKEINLMMK